jgi:hypothetical protein
MKETKYPNGKHPNSLKNLQKWAKGQSGNPKGRAPNELCFTAIAKKMLPEICPYDAKGRTWAEYLVERWLAQSVKNPAYFHELIERLEGKVVQPIEGTIKTDVTFTIGKGYANGKPDIQPDKSDAG